MSRNLLIYEADVTNAQALSELFSGWGFKVYTAASPDKVQDIMAKAKPDVFIIRAENPVSTKGFAFCSQLRKMPEYAKTPILILSSEFSQEQFDKHASLPGHADDYLHIPVDNDTLIARLELIFPFIDGLPDDDPDFSSDIAELKKRISNLENDNDMLTVFNHEMKERVKKADSEVESFRKERDEALSKFKEIEEKFDSTLDSVKKEKEQQIRQLTDSNKAVLDKLSAEHKAAIDKLTSENKAAFDKAKGEADARISSLSTELADLKAGKQAEIDQAKANCDSKIRSYEKQVTENMKKVT